MKKIKIYSFVLLLFLIGSCSKDFIPDQDSNDEVSLKSSMPKLKIAVMPGLNYLDPSLMVDCLDEGTDFRNDKTTYHMLVEFSKPILDEAISQILKEKPDLLLIPGDLTYCGEKISHEAVAERLGEIAEQGIKVFVTPGNQDIDSPSSMAYNVASQLDGRLSWYGNFCSLLSSSESHSC
ncbi:MAG: metallophosphoesterase [Bacteroidales bacterium]|nr:metallophosphoesterase [Bacteroidales bacterium]